jgi:hypothetical protein
MIGLGAELHRWRDRFAIWSVSRLRSRAIPAIFGQKSHLGDFDQSRRFRSMLLTLETPGAMVMSVRQPLAPFGLAGAQLKCIGQQLQAEPSYLGYIDTCWVSMLISLAAVPLGAGPAEVKLGADAAGDDQRPDRRLPRQI